MLQLNVLDHKDNLGQEEVNNMFYQSPFNYALLINEMNNNPEKALLFKAIEKLDDGFFDGHLLLNQLIQKSNIDALLVSALYSQENENENIFLKRHILTLEKLVELNHPLALYALGVYYDQGKFVLEDKNKAAHLFKLSSDLGIPQANFIYGVMLYYGTGGMDKDTEKALDLLNRAIAMNIQEAKEFLDYLNNPAENKNGR